MDADMLKAFGKHMGHGLLSAAQTEELKKEVHNIIYVLIQNVFREQSEYEYAEMRTTFLKEPRKLAPPTYKEW